MIRLLAVPPALLGLVWLANRMRPRRPLHVGPDTLRRLRREEEQP